MRGLLQLAAIVLFILAALSAFGWLLDADLEHALGFVAFGLAAWCASSYSPPVHGA